MNRRNNLINYFKSWLNNNINQIIILDWASNENNYDIISNLNDNRVMYIRVNEEDKFIRTYAQNLAAKFCRYNKILKIDSDINLSEDFFDRNNLEPGTFIAGNHFCARNKNETYTHGNIYLYLDDYFAINGYSELIKTLNFNEHLPAKNSLL